MKKLLLILLLICSVGFSQTGPQITQVRTFENLAALRATAPTATGTWAYTRGYSTSGDGGGGFWTYSPASSAADNSGTIVAPTGYTTGRWLRDMSSDSEYKIEWFGGSTSAIDNSAALLAAVTAANGRVVRMGAGTYAFTNEVLLEAPITGFNIRGVAGAWSVETASMLGTILVNNIATAGSAIIKTTIAPHKNTALADLSFIGTSATDGMVGVSFQKSFSRVLLERLSFKNLNHAIRIGYGEVPSTVSGYYSTVNNVSIDNCGNGVYSNCLLNGTPFHQLRINGITGVGLTVANSSDLRVHNSWFENCVTAISLNGIYSVVISDSYFEGALATGQTQLVCTNSANVIFENNNVRRSGVVIADVELKRRDSTFSVINNTFRIHSDAERMYVTGVTGNVASGTVDTSRAISGKFISMGNSFELDSEMGTASEPWFYFQEYSVPGVTSGYCKTKIFCSNTLNDIATPNIFYTPYKVYGTAYKDEFMVGTIFLNDIPSEILDYAVASSTPYSYFGGTSYGSRAVFASGSLRLMASTGLPFQINVDGSGTLTATSTLTP